MAFHLEQKLINGVRKTRNTQIIIYRYAYIIFEGKHTMGIWKTLRKKQNKYLFFTKTTMKIKKLINHGNVWGDHYKRLDWRCEDEQRRITLQGVWHDPIGELDIEWEKRMERAYQYRAKWIVTGKMERVSGVTFA